MPDWTRHLAFGIVMAALVVTGSVLMWWLTLPVDQASDPVASSWLGSVVVLFGG